jgi:hypothetical protein
MQLFPLNHLYAIYRADLQTETTAVAIFVGYYQEPLHHLAGVEIADLGAISAVSARLHIGLFHQVASVANNILRVFKISTTIVTTKTDPVGFGVVASVAERAADQMFFAGFFEYFLHLRPAYLFETGAI